MNRALIDAIVAMALAARWKIRESYLWLRYGRITHVDKSIDGGVVSEVAYYGRRGRMISYWAYGYYDPGMPYRGDPSMKRILTEAIVVTAIAAGAVLAAFYTGRAEAHTYGANLVTAHSSGGYRWDTPGLYVRRDDGLTLGALRNSLGRTSFHASQTWERGPWAVQAGAITGYPMAPVVPLLTGSVLIGNHRLILIPGPRNRAALHYAVEWR